ncbi:hypothetical protein AK830_g3286 [Neonectria ditissima]|uniref:Uncharacterized protein n=1 Tax=Neonectria ditissima TaxID=78410 RepID=A0A0P7AZX4_9HYPO|nr:hypothetical protein AK830_g3286 [Neonectria ditissima]
MGLELDLRPCICTPSHPHHPPPSEKPLRIQIEGPKAAVQRLLPDIQWYTNVVDLEFPQPAGLELAKMAYQKIYGREARSDIAGDLVVRDEYLGWIERTRQAGLDIGATDESKFSRGIDYYGVTFDHLVPSDDVDPEVLQINIIDIEDDEGEYANESLPFSVDPAEFDPE